MIELIWDEGFKKRLKRLLKNNEFLKSKFEEKIEIFCLNPYDQRLKTHKLSGNLKDLWALRVDYDCRIIFKFISESEVLLIDIVGHDEVY